MTELLPHLANPWWLLLLGALPLLAWHHHRRQSLGALTYSRLPSPAAGRQEPPQAGAGAAGDSAATAGSFARAGSAAAGPASSAGRPTSGTAATGPAEIRSPSRPWRPGRRPGGGGRGGWRLHLPFYLRLAAFGLVALALARPQLGYSWEESLTEGIDIELLLDISGSMAAEDFQPQNRLAVAKQVVKQFVTGRTGDRIGLLTVTEFVQLAQLTAAATTLPLICDADTGFGESLNVERTVRLFEQAGAASLPTRVGCYRQFRRDFPAGGVRVEARIEVEPDLPMPDIEPNQIQQVFVNLINNAAQAIASTGRLGTIVVRARRWLDGVAIDVIDDGPGMPEALASQVFEPTEGGAGA